MKKRILIIVFFVTIIAILIVGYFTVNVNKNNIGTARYIYGEKNIETKITHLKYNQNKISSRHIQEGICL